MRYTSGASVLSLEREGPYDHIEVGVVNPRPFPLAYVCEHGSSRLAGEVPAGSETTVQLPYDPGCRAASAQLRHVGARGGDTVS